MKSYIWISFSILLHVSQTQSHSLRPISLAKRQRDSHMTDDPNYGETYNGTWGSNALDYLLGPEGNGGLNREREVLDETEWENQQNNWEHIGLCPVGLGPAGSGGRFCHSFCGDSPSNNCWGLFFDDWSPAGPLTSPDGEDFEMGRCVCEPVPLVDEIIPMVNEVLWEIHEFLCPAIRTGLQLLIEFGPTVVGFIPGPGPAASAAARIAVQAARFVADVGGDVASYNAILPECERPTITDELFGQMDEAGIANNLGVPVPEGFCVGRRRSRCRSPDRRDGYANPSSIPDRPSGRPTDRPTDRTEDRSTTDNSSPGSTRATTTSSINNSQTRSGSSGQPTTRSTRSSSDTDASQTSRSSSEEDASRTSRSSSEEDACDGGPASGIGKRNACTTTAGNGHIHITTTTSSRSTHYTSTVTCDGARWPQACYHYRSVMRVHSPRWQQFTCPPRSRVGRATASWSSSTFSIGVDRTRTATQISPNDQHNWGWWRGWTEEQRGCDRDEFPPHRWWRGDAAERAHQRIRLIPEGDNRGAGNLFSQACNARPDSTISSSTSVHRRGNRVTTYTSVSVEVTTNIATMVFRGLNANDDGLSSNPCWPSRLIPGDAGFALLTQDEYYGGRPPVTNYAVYPPQAVINDALNNNRNPFGRTLDALGNYDDGTFPNDSDDSDPGSESDPDSGSEDDPDSSGDYIPKKRNEAGLNQDIGGEINQVSDGDGYGGSEWDYWYDFDEMADGYDYLDPLPHRTTPAENEARVTDTPNVLEPETFLTVKRSEVNPQVAEITGI